MVMGIHEFGRALIETHDLDPVYDGFVGAGMPEDQQHRWLLAYWCFYHAGSACWLSEQEGKDFSHWMLVAAGNEDRVDLYPPADTGMLRWPRSAERRHFRGQKCVYAVDHLCDWAVPPESRVRGLYEKHNDMSLAAVMGRVQKWPLFGPWIAFKAADMLERCLGVPVQFPNDIGLVYSEPREALNILSGTPDGKGFWDGEREWSPQEVYEELLDRFELLPAPPGGDRPCGPQEVETVLCKWKSHYNGHYQVGKDVHEVRSGLRGWGSTAARFLAAMPKEVPNV